MTRPVAGPSSSSLIRVAELPLPAAGFDEFTYPRYQGLLAEGESGEASNPRLAVAAWQGNTPVGLVLFSRPFREIERRLLSILVRPTMRRQRIGSRLLGAGEALTAERGTRKLWAVHSSHLQSIGAYDHCVAGLATRLCLPAAFSGLSIWQDRRT